MNDIKIAMCDDVEQLCLNIRDFCKYSDGIEFVGYCNNVSECIDMLKKSKPDILLLDIQIETEDAGIKIIPDILEVMPELKIIMLTAYADSGYIFEAIVSGASDYIVKTCTMEEIINKIKSVYNNDNNLEPEILAKFKQKSQDLAKAHKNLLYMLNIMITLSSTELEVLKELYNGKTYNDISRTRFVETSTVRSMSSRILKKFGASSMNSLITTLHEMKIFDMFIK